MRSKNNGFAHKLITALAALMCLVIAFGTGYWLSPGSPELPTGDTSHADHVEEESIIWTCAMHPQIRRNEPGKCPICGMNLVPVSESPGDSLLGERAFVTSPEAVALMNIQTAPVERRYAPMTIRMTGSVDYDETKVSHITAWVPGRLDRLYVDYTGVTVQKGDHMVELYSPELLTAEEELWRAAQTVKKLRSDSPASLRRTAQTTLDASRRKLKLWGLTVEQIVDVEKNGVTSDQVTIYAPSGGTVVELEGQQGMYVNTGSRIYTIVDLSEVWVRFDAYESDLTWLHFGQNVTFVTEAWPGEEFKGRIAFIDPVLNTMTRTVKVRVNVSNEDGRLKPGMFVRGDVEAQIATKGRVMNPELAGKWIGPMHPQIVKDGPGACEICGMDLVPAEELGYVTATADEAAMPLVIPATAPLLTGKRAVVYVQVMEAKNPTFEGRQVVLGPRAGDYYIVEEGLEEGERVVTNGAFKIDSALEIMAKPSMMNPEGGGGAVHRHGGMPPATQTNEHESHVAPASDMEMGSVGSRETLTRYLAIQAALANNDAEQAKEAAQAMHHAVMSKSNDTLKTGLERFLAAPDIAAQRTIFSPLSQVMMESLSNADLGSGDPVYVLHCPMAFDGKGADWLQTSTATRNPYYEGSMSTCGSVSRVLIDEHGHAPHGETP